MAVVTLTFTGSDEEITAGIPRYITITSNVPSTIYFTLDGSVPTINSPIYIDTFEMPDGETSVTLSAFGVDYDGYLGPILTQVFAADQSTIDVTRNIGLEGVVVDRYVDPTDIPVGYGYSGYLNAVSDIPRIDLEEIHSARGRLGIAEGTQIEVGTPPPEDTAYPFDDEFQPSSKTSDDFFNPYAKTIVVDNREENVIRITSRPWGSLRTNSMHKNVWSRQELRGSDSTYISGGYIRHFYSPEKNTMVGYLFDHNTNRWVKSIQELPSNIPAFIGHTKLGPPLVIQWIGRGRHSIIPV